VCVKFCFLLGKLVPHPPYSPDLAPCDFFLFASMKAQKKGKRFADVREVKKKTLEVLNNISTEKISRNVFSSGKHVGTSVSSLAARLLRSWVRIPPGAWIFVCCECRVLSGRGLCDELITRPEESYRLCCVVVCDLETSRIGAP